MSGLTHWEHFFKPEVRKAGSDLLRKEVLFLKPSSDTQIEAGARASTPARITFRTPSISSPEFSVDCSCPASKKGQFCKHIWATLLLVEQKSPDFLDSKREIKKGEPPGDTAPISARDRIPAVKGTASQAQADYKQKQAAFRKQAYQIQKQRLKDTKKTSRFKDPSRSKLSIELPIEIESAIKYFENNGFPMTPPFEEAAVNHAKRVLSKVFHPDKGGSHDEVVDLLRHAEALLNYSYGFVSTLPK
ncbi:MAG: SWIM zinc finger family protein [Bdellovibrionales bacterium]|nr:SWIM zinc finger family protein [Bdellovibrionales bacterium]